MMEYPIFDVPQMGGSMVIAVVAIVHVFISHFSVGAGFLMASLERSALRRGDAETISFLKRYGFMVLLIPYVLGTVTGVGIWFTIGLVHPRATSVLIHQFVWDWAIEWVFFIVEVVVIYLYVFRWARMDPKTHNRLGWIFAFCSLGTLLIINGILSFMLTPGQWQPFDAGALNYKALVNPTYLPTSLGRIAISLALAGVAAVVLVALDRKMVRRVREVVVAHAYKLMLPAVLCIPLGYWTFTRMSRRAQAFLVGGEAPMMLFLGFGVLSMLILVFAAAVSLFRKDFAPSSLGAVLLCLLAFVSFGSMEFVREGARKPYVIEGFMYSTGVTHPKYADVDRRANLHQTSQSGVLSAAPWAVAGGADAPVPDSLELGGAVYKAACLRCHSVDGYNAVRPLIRGWSRKTLHETLNRLDEIKPAMPPFPGTEAEKAALVTYLHSLDDRSGT